MNVIVGDSRAKGLGNSNLKGIVEVWCRPGTGLRVAQNNIQEHYIMHHGGQPIYSNETHYYVMSGICDITKRLSNKKLKYQEIVYLENPTDTTNRIIPLLEDIHKDTINIDCKPILCPIYPIDLESWNLNRLSQHKTSTLNHKDDYPQMQLALDAAIAEINKFILHLNKSVMVSTPMIHHSMLHNHRKGKKNWQYFRLIDGCHPGEQMKQDIITSLHQAIKKNRI